ncbi:hypothetical protein PGT21_024833 [Puccinia graminis f. sp. tritici]|uniref:Uncharacterized protein n=1 Tax=Puccinia graminis f. sp. tritici TaxID=56615 RepID=A0A5B0QIQ9_PUCGR|nr:hypothetical protein PGT21_024833 [Puccinia graminis f. sp. tritici]
MSTVVPSEVIGQQAVPKCKETDDLPDCCSHCPLERIAIAPLGILAQSGPKANTDQITANSDRITALFVAEILSKRPGGHVILAESCPKANSEKIPAFIVADQRIDKALN